MEPRVFRPGATSEVLVTRTSLVFALALGALASPIVIDIDARAAVPADQANQAGAKPQPKSTALIVGRVVDGTSGEPIGEAVVTMTPGRGRGGLDALPQGMTPEIQQAMQAALAAAGAGRGPTGQQRVMTGSDGRFVFHNLPPGPVTLSATLTGYTSSLTMTQIPGLPGIMASLVNQSSPTVLTLKEGEFATDVRLRLWKHAVVSGTVLDDAGEPAVGLTVQLARRTMAAGRARYMPALSAKTDDRGAYRISSVVPGDYVVVVPQAQASIPAALLGGMVEAVKSGGAGMGVAALSMLDVMSSGINIQEAITGGVRIGDFMVASSGAVPIVGPGGRLLAYQTQFYPGAFAPAQAAVVSLAPGEEKTDANFQLQLIPTSRVSGVAMGPDGPVENLGIKLVVPGDGVVSDSEFDVATAVTKKDGSFAFYGVPPGQFLLKAQKQPRPAIPAEAMAANPMAANMFGGGIPAGAKEAVYAVTTITVEGGSDLDNQTVRLVPGYTVSGRVEFSSVTGRPQPPAGQIASAVVNLVPVDGQMPSLLAMATPDRPNAQGEFKTKGYAPGKYFLSINGFGGWQVKSATIGGRDVLDAALEIREADLAGVVVTFTDKVAQITGTVRSPGESDLSETAVLVFPVNFRNWAANGMNPRRGLSARATRDGSFTIPNVPAGDYFIAAVDRATQGELQDPAYLDALSRVATRISVGEDPVKQELTKTKVQR
jgi:protocatechuate 3,4-dioxygenase beta subunit